MQEPHKAILMIAYSSGLRVSEVVKLKVEDVDSKRMLIYIKGAKGRKDRYTVLSETVLEILRQYWKKYKPQKWLLKGQKMGDTFQQGQQIRFLEMRVRKPG